jgi:NAD(P)-dependent dehydrogenase (short-subunit alcohol dehydrogenase family)
MCALESNGRVVLITGASSGIGRGLALEFAKRGWAVGLVARRKHLVDEVAAEIIALGGTSLAVEADVTIASEINQAVSSVAGALGRIDIFVANAGIGGTLYARKFDTDQFARVINTNLIGAANSVAAVLKVMLGQGYGQIVGISSLAAYRGLPKSGAYCASKAGLSSFLESLRLDLRGTGIDVTIIHPGFIKTALTSGRSAKMPFLMELPDAVTLMTNAIISRRKTYAFPWQLAWLVRLAMVVPTGLYDRIAARNSFRE